MIVKKECATKAMVIVMATGWRYSTVVMSILMIAILHYIIREQSIPHVTKNMKTIASLLS